MIVCLILLVLVLIVCSVFGIVQDVECVFLWGGVYFFVGFILDLYEFDFVVGGLVYFGWVVCSFCLGNIIDEFSVEIYYNVGLFLLIFSVFFGIDVMFVIFGLDNVWYCDDDSGYGINFCIEFNCLYFGSYLIWVGSYVVNI